MKALGILPGHTQSYIDHIVPLCQIMGAPLLVTDLAIQQLVERYYPPMEIILAEPEDYNLDPYLEGYDAVYYVDFFRRGNSTFHFRDYVARRNVRSVMSLHGNPDKYWDIYWLEQLTDEDIILAYGPQLTELLRHKGITKQPIVSGNYRLAFYKEHASFFDSKLPFKKEKTTLLYAPTWASEGRKTAHRDYYSSFLDAHASVFDTLARDYQLIVKLHPHLVQFMPTAVEEVMSRYPHIYFLSDFPPIYPILEQIDLYLGDYSSIGYDFLYYDRPLFFLDTHEQTALQRYGKRVTKEELPHLASQAYARKELYDHVYGPEKDLKQLKREIADACRSDPR